jgi:hypothetical protein
VRMVGKIPISCPYVKSLAKVSSVHVWLLFGAPSPLAGGHWCGGCSSATSLASAGFGTWRIRHEGLKL